MTGSGFLLEVNNHVVSKLDIMELFRSASASIRSYFRNDFTGFWLIDKDSNQLELAVLDFPASKGFLTDARGSRTQFQQP